MLRTFGNGHHARMVIPRRIRRSLADIEIPGYEALRDGVAHLRRFLG
jgi:hypothetical protein